MPTGQFIPFENSTSAGLGTGTWAWRFSPDKDIEIVGLGINIILIDSTWVKLLLYRESDQARLVDTGNIAPQLNQGSWNWFPINAITLQQGEWYLVAAYTGEVFLKCGTHTGDSTTRQFSAEGVTFSVEDHRYFSSGDAFPTRSSFQTGIPDLGLEFIVNTPPNTPVSKHISSTGYTINRRPKLFLSVSDPDAGHTIQNVQIQINTASDFSGTMVADVQYGTDSGYGTQTAGWSGLPTSDNGDTTITWTPQSDLLTGTVYMRARAKDSTGDWSAWSATQQFSVQAAPWSDAVQDNLPAIKAQWLNDIATVINAARQFRALSTASFTDGTLQAGVHDCRAIYFTERRQKLTDVLNIVGVTPTWETPTLDNTVDRTGRLINELREYCSQT